jgi:HEPN domain-containing protein
MNKQLPYLLLEISKSDIIASRILLCNELYAHAVFHLQQAVEKALKATLIALKIAPEEKGELEKWLTQDIRHEIVKNYLKIAEKCFEITMDKVKSMEEVQVRQLALLLIKSIGKIFKKVKHKYREEIVTPVKKLDIAKNEDVDKLIDMTLLRIQEKSFLDSSEILEEMVRSIGQILASSKLEQLPQNFNLIIDLIIQQLRKEIESRLQIIVATSQLLALSLLLEKYVTVSRYPKVTNPSLGPHILTPGYPLVNKLELLQNFAEKAINQLDQNIK